MQRLSTLRAAELPVRWKLSVSPPVSSAGVRDGCEAPRCSAARRRTSLSPSVSKQRLSLLGKTPASHVDLPQSHLAFSRWSPSPTSTTSFSSPASSCSASLRSAPWCHPLPWSSSPGTVSRSPLLRPSRELCSASTATRLLCVSDSSCVATNGACSSLSVVTFSPPSCRSQLFFASSLSSSPSSSSPSSSLFPPTPSPRLRQIQALVEEQNFETFRYKQILEQMYCPALRQGKASSSLDASLADACSLSRMQSVGRPLLKALSDLCGRMYAGNRAKQAPGEKRETHASEEGESAAGGDAGGRRRGGNEARNWTPRESFLSLESLQESTDKNARKILFRCRQDDARVEAVALAFPRHVSLCISSQAGCAFNCSFCSVGKSGFLRQLSADEITDQVLFFLRQGIKIDSVSFMGMGEPLANPKMFDAIRILTDPLLFNFSARKLAVSTLGVLPGIKKLTEEHPQVNLAFSLHSPFPEERNILVPANRMFPMEEVFDLLDERLAKTGRRIWISYILIKGRNNTEEHAKALAALLRERRRPTRHLYHVNVIPYNTAQGVESSMQPPSATEVNHFTDLLRKLHLSVSRRHTIGSAIDAACGQMHAEYEVGQLTKQRKAQQADRKKEILERGT